MKLIKLELSAFGPFATTQSIDFVSLGENPLFLIDGPTGAGKSSILHAICYALYGETTDSERKEAGIRCDNAADDLLTEVSLTFVIRGETYRITRTPKQMRPALRGGGMTEVQPTANLVKIDGEGHEESLVPKKKSEADQRIREILGLTADQFRQVMVLPQGKFRELLLAKSDDRQAILSTLFQTEIYKRIENLLKERAADIERQNKRFEDQKTEILKKHSVDSVEALLDAISSAEQASLDAQAQKQTAQTAHTAVQQELTNATALKKSFDDLQTAVDSRTSHCSSEQVISDARQSLERATLADALAPIWRELNALRKRMTETAGQITAEKANESRLTDLHTAAFEKLENAQREAHSLDELKAKLLTLTAIQKQLAQYAAAKLDAEQSSKAFSDVEASISNTKAQIAQFEKEISNLETLINERSGVLDSEADRITGLSNARQIVQLISKRDKTLQEIVNAGVLVAEAESAQSEALQAVREAKQAADRLEMNWFSNQAAILARTLGEHEPCPVCGSEDHPNPTQFNHDGQAVEKADVDVARNKEEQLRAVLRGKETAFNTAVLTRQNLEKQLSDLKTELSDQSHISMADASALVNVAEQAIADLQAAKTLISESKQRLKTLTDNLKSTREKASQLNAQHSAALADKTHKASALEHLEQAIPEDYRDSKKLAAEVSEISKAIERITTSVEAAQTAYTHSADSLSVLRGKIKGLEEQGKALDGQLKAQEASWTTALSESIFDTQSAFEAALLSSSEQARLRESIQRYDVRLSQLNAQIELLSKQLEGKSNPDLDEIETRLKLAGDTLESADKHWISRHDQLRSLQNDQTSIERIDAEQQRIQGDFNVVGRLSRAASGNGKVRVSLERFVLGNLLDSVLAVASTRLHKMSKGQYRLVRQDESDANRKKTAGLDLAIDDAHSGKTRPVSTLSGGESFMASLSLALALSDVVQQRSGGIQLDTLFVDEGFGSLDQDSLQLAINTLVDLQATGRTIGIISHVSELKEQMAKRIDVLPGVKGSSINDTSLRRANSV